MNVRHDLAAQQAERTARFTLPDVPAPDDHAGLLDWLTVALALDPAYPVVKVERFGRRTSDATVVLTRAGAPTITFEPVEVVNAPTKLTTKLIPQLVGTDRPTPGYKAEHCRTIYQVLVVICGAAEQVTDAQETTAIVGHLLGQAEVVEGCTTYGTAAERYEALEQLQGDGAGLYRQRVLIDANTGEYVVRVSDLADVARRYLGGSLTRGWLDARMAGIGWERRSLSAHAAPGRVGRRAGHLHFDCYRGIVVADESDGPAVTP